MGLTLIKKQGRLFIPAEVKTEFALSPGMRLVVRQEDNGQMWLQPESPKVVEKAGVFVIEAQAMSDLTNVVRQEREGRLSELLERMGADESSI